MGRIMELFTELGNAVHSGITAADSLDREVAAAHAELAALDVARDESTAKRAEIDALNAEVAALSKQKQEIESALNALRAKLG